MIVDAKKIGRLSVLQPILVPKESDGISRHPDEVFERVHEDHVIHGTDLPLACETVLTGIVKTMSRLYDYVNGDRYDRWIPITLEEFEKSTENWIRRSAVIGEDLDYYLEVLQDRNILHVVRLGQEKNKIFIALTKDGVNLILRTMGFKTFL